MTGRGSFPPYDCGGGVEAESFTPYEFSALSRREIFESKAVSDVVRAVAGSAPRGGDDECLDASSLRGLNGGTP